MKALACIAAAAFYGLAALFPVAAGGSMPSGSPHSGIRPVDGTDSGMLSVTDTLPGPGATSCGLDSLQRKAVSQKVGEYLSAIVTEPVSMQEKEVDFLIETCSDSLVRQAVATDIYSFYRDSPIMGAEALAVYVCDKWFIPGKVKLPDEASFMGARMFAEFNRRSLIGMKAPGLELKDSLGNEVRLFGPQDKPEDRRYSILYFYSPDCARCRMETIMLRSILENDGFPVDFHAIYTGRNRAEWMKYIHSQMDISPVSTRIFHLWDPEMDSDFQIKYGIMQTPGLFLIAPDGTIAGRRLDAVSLEKMLKDALAPAEAEYGSEESEKFFDKVFAPFADSVKCKDIDAIARHIEDVTLGQGDTLLFKQMTGDLMYYLTNRRGAAYRCATGHLVKDRILGKDVWKTADDSLKIVSFARILDDLLSKTPVSARIPDIKVDAVLKMNRGGEIRAAEGRFRLGKTGGRQTYIIFHTEGCPVCKAEINAADSLLLHGSIGTRVLLVDMDMIFSSNPGQAGVLLDTFDLTMLPFIISTDRKGKVTGKYLSLL